MDEIKFVLPNTQALVELEKNKPTQEERISALEAAMLEQILAGGFDND